MESEQEITLAKVRLHWGIFVPMALAAFALIGATWPFIFMANVANNVVSQMAIQFKDSPVTPRFNLVWLLVLPLGFVIVPGLLATWFTYSKSEIILTNRRLYYRSGFLSRRSGELPLENVESIFISEPLLGRIFGYGTVMVTTVGGARFPFAFIGMPQNFHSMLQKTVGNFKKSIRPNAASQQGPSSPQDGDARYMPKG